MTFYSSYREVPKTEGSRNRNSAVCSRFNKSEIDSDRFKVLARAGATTVTTTIVSLVQKCRAVNGVINYLLEEKQPCKRKAFTERNSLLLNLFLVSWQSIVSLEQRLVSPEVISAGTPP